jgi:hypothetical protein
MLCIRSVDPPIAVLFIGQEPLLSGLMTPAEWAAYCKSRGVIVLVAEEEGTLVGWAVAESFPRCLEVLRIEGDTETCRLLLGHLVRAAGERDISGPAPLDRPDLSRLFERLGFVRSGNGLCDGVPSASFYLDRNPDL